MSYPEIIQGGMGIGVSCWKLSRAVSIHGGLGVTSGTASDFIMTRRLQDGDIGGHIRRALSFFPNQLIANEVIKKFFLPDGRKKDSPYRSLTLYQNNVPKSREWLSVLGSFVEIFLAKEGHNGLVGMNLLHKIQLPTMASIYGALIAKVDYLLIGAGIPKDIPVVLDALTESNIATMKLDIEGGGDETLYFDPKEYPLDLPITIKRPKFLPIISSHLLGQMLLKKDPSKIDGFIVENNIAGGHNAPPREKNYSENGEPIYGLRDQADLEKLRQLGKPFWLAGACGNHDSLHQAKEAGAMGVQVGTPFAFCNESGITQEIKNKVLVKIQTDTAKVVTDAKASPTGFPFKIFQLEETGSEQNITDSRCRVCDVGLLRTAYRKEDGSVGFRCSGEPIKEYLKKGGKIEDTVGRKCICNGLLATIGLGQTQKNKEKEPSLITAGSDLTDVRNIVARYTKNYSAKDVINYITNG